MANAVNSLDGDRHGSIQEIRFVRKIRTIADATVVNEVSCGLKPAYRVPLGADLGQSLLNNPFGPIAAAMRPDLVSLRVVGSSV